MKPLYDSLHNFYQFDGNNELKTLFQQVKSCYKK